MTQLLPLCERVDGVAEVGAPPYPVARGTLDWEWLLQSALSPPPSRSTISHATSLPLLLSHMGDKARKPGARVTAAERGDWSCSLSHFKSSDATELAWGRGVGASLLNLDSPLPPHPCKPPHLTTPLATSGQHCTSMARSVQLRLMLIHTRCATVCVCFWSSSTSAAGPPIATSPHLTSPCLVPSLTPAAALRATPRTIHLHVSAAAAHGCR